MVATIIEYAWLIPALPLASFVIALVAGHRLPAKGAYPGILLTAGSLVLSVWTLLTVRTSGSTFRNELYTWAGIEELPLTLGIFIDPLSAFMLVLVGLIATLVHVFSLGYMNADERHRERGGLPRYYASLGLFTTSMLAFVFSSNLLMAFLFFELVGLCSYLLIGFWQTDRAPPSAAKKAFLLTRFGDYFLLVGVVGILVTFNSTTFAGAEAFPTIAEQVISDDLATTSTTVWLPGDFSPTQWFTILGLLVLGGAIGKSAQFPLHTWLPDAMEGPTPISALIHAATMVAAGVYLLARMYGFYALLPTMLAIIAFIGGFTALFAATMGAVKDDLKQVLAYSTISQYGYMMLGLGIGGYVAATFHLMNHAYFKALLFLCAGAIIVVTHHHQDMWELGGLKDELPIVHYTFLAGSLALAGIIPFSGFWSKDAILYEALLVGLDQPLFLGAYAMGLLGVFLTGFYTFRMYFLTFHGQPRSDGAADPDAVGLSMTVPILVLGVLATVAGFINMKPLAEATGWEILYFEHWLNSGFAALQYEHYATLVADVGTLTMAELGPYLPAGVTLAASLGGIYMAHLRYNVPTPEPDTDNGPITRVVANNYYQDELQVWLATGIVQPVARALNTFDQGVIDGIINGIGGASLVSGERVRRIQNGVVTNYVLLIVLSVVLLLVFVALTQGWWQ